MGEHSPRRGLGLTQKRKRGSKSLKPSRSGMGNRSKKRGESLSGEPVSQKKLLLNIFKEGSKSRPQTKKNFVRLELPAMIAPSNTKSNSETRTKEPGTPAPARKNTKKIKATKEVGGTKHDRTSHERTQEISRTWEGRARLRKKCATEK